MLREGSAHYFALSSGLTTTALCSVVGCDAGAAVLDTAEEVTSDPEIVDDALPTVFDATDETEYVVLDAPEAAKWLGVGCLREKIDS